MSDDYLWDRSGPPDPAVRELERKLKGFRYRPKRRWWPLAIAAAAAALVAVGLQMREPPAAWNVEWIEGSGESRLQVGEWLATGDGRARIEVADIGSVDVQPQSKVRLVRTGETEHRLALQEGRLEAMVYAPPRLFVVDTPGAAAVDLGCAYTLEVDANGVGLLDVTSGYVQLEAKDAPASYVPQGAICRMRPGKGPGVPYFRDAPEALRDVDPADEAAVRAALDAARPRDSLTLWHLVPRVDATLRHVLVDRLARWDLLERLW